MEKLPMPFMACIRQTSLSCLPQLRPPQKAFHLTMYCSYYCYTFYYLRTCRVVKSGLGLYFVAFDFVVSTSVLFYICSCKSGRIGMECGRQNIVPEATVNPAQLLRVIAGYAGSWLIRLAFLHLPAPPLLPAGGV